MKYNRNYGCRITDDLVFRGINIVVMENEKLRVTILKDKGTDIYEFLYKPLDIDFLWRSPLRLQNPATYIPTTGGERGAFADYYEGGWQDILPNGGTACEYMGAMLGQHGEVSTIPWNCQIVKDEEEEIVVKFYVRATRTPLYVDKTISLKANEPVLHISETVLNEGLSDIHVMWGQHPTLGGRFLSEDCVISTNAKTGTTQKERLYATQRLAPGQEFRWPYARKDAGIIDLGLMPKQGSGVTDMFYLSDFEGENGWYQIYNRKLGLGLDMEWDKGIFRYLWVWLMCNGDMQYPWYGRAYTVALEPWTSYPTSGLANAVKNGSALRLKANQAVTTAFSVRVSNERKQAPA